MQTAFQPSSREVVTIDARRPLSAPRAPEAERSRALIRLAMVCCVYGFHQCFGLLGFVFFRLLLCLGVTAALHRFIAKREPRFLIATVLTCAATLGVAMLFKERPWLFTILFSVLTLDVILDLRAGRSSLVTWLLPLAFVVWANVHIQFIYGLILLFIACSAPLIEHLARRDQSRITPPTPLP